MKFRGIFFGILFLLALSASFGFKANRPYTVGNAILNGFCTTGNIDQHTCGTLLTGPVCTITFGVLGPKTAYLITNPSCTMVLRQP
jgi:hypothetical protein